MTIEVTRTVLYKGGMRIHRGTRISGATLINENEDVPGGFSVPHPRFNDVHIRAHVPSTHAEVVGWDEALEQYRPGDLF